MSWIVDFTPHVLVNIMENVGILSVCKNEQGRAKIVSLLLNGRKILNPAQKHVMNL